ncbi:hypothetical protein Tco_0432891 [Tanacetum coccineum]
MEYCEDEDDCFTNFESAFPAIVLDNTITDRELLVNGKPNGEPRTVYSNDLDFFKDFKNEFPAIVYNDALMSKSDFLTEHTISPQHIDEFNNETSLPKCDEKEQNILYLNDLLPFNVIYPDDLKWDMDYDNDKIDIEQPSGDMSIIPSPNSQIEHDDLEEMALNGRWAMLSMKVECFNFIEGGHFCNGNVRAQRNQGNKIEDAGIGRGTTPEGFVPSEASDALG